MWEFLAVQLDLSKVSIHLANIFMCDDLFSQIYLINMDVILTLSIKFRLSWDSNTVDCRQVAEQDKVLSDRQNVRSSVLKIIMLLYCVGQLNDANTNEEFFF